MTDSTPTIWTAHYNQFFEVSKLAINLGWMFAAAFSFLYANPTSAEVMDNSTVVLLVKSGLGEALVVDKINSLPCGYDVSTKELITLKQQGISDGVIAAMVRRCATLSQVRGVAGDNESSDPMVKHSPGIYLVENWTNPAKMIGLRPTKPSGIRTTGNGSILFPLNYKMTFPGLTSQVLVRTETPTFYFYFDESDGKVSDFGMENSAAAQSPDEFNLVQLQVKSENREVSIGRASAYGGAAMTMRKGIDPKLAIKMSTEPMGHGIFKVTCDRNLLPGEYGFVFTASDTKSRVYLFSVIS